MMIFIIKVLILCIVELVLMMLFPKVEFLTWFTLAGFLYLSLLLYNLFYSLLGGISAPTFPESSITRMHISNFIDKTEDKIFANKIVKLSEVFDSTNGIYLVLLIINIVAYMVVNSK